MNIENAEKLLKKYRQGRTNLREEKQLRKYLNRSDIPEALKPEAEQFRQFDAAGKEKNRVGFDPLAKINFEEKPNPSVFKQKKRFGYRRKNKTVQTAKSNYFSWLPQIAAGIALLIIGFAAGLYWSAALPTVKNNEPGNGQINARNSQQVNKDKADAFIATKKALKIVAVNLNTGKKEIQKVAVFNEIPEKIAGQQLLKPQLLKN